MSGINKVASSSNDSLVANLIGLVGVLIRGLFMLVVAFHRRFTFTALGLWVALIAFIFYVNGSGWLSLLVIAGAVTLYHFKAKQYRSYLIKKSFVVNVRSLMGLTLWKDLKARKYVNVQKTDLDDIYKVNLSTPAGETDEAVIKTLPTFSAGLGIAFTEVLQNEDSRAGKVSVLFGAYDPLLTKLEGSLAPVLHMTEKQRNDPYYWLPCGIDSQGRKIEFPLFLKDLGSMRSLHAGESGSGKSSVFVQQLIQAVLCPSIEVLLLDGKGGSEFPLFEDHVEMYGRNTKDFWEQVNYLEAECTRRALILGKNKSTQTNRFSNTWNHHDDGKMIVWFWDELGKILNAIKPNARQEAYEKLYSVLSIARSLGIACVMSGQTFRAEILPTSIRDSCFNLSVGYKLKNTVEGNFIGFDATDLVHPSLIKGEFLKSGKFSRAGTFATVGLKSTFALSYYLETTDILKGLENHNVLSDNEAVSLVKDSIKNG